MVNADENTITPLIPVARDFLEHSPVVIIAPPLGVICQDWFDTFLDYQGGHEYYMNDLQAQTGRCATSKFNGLETD